MIATSFVLLLLPQALPSYPDRLKLPPPPTAARPATVELPATEIERFRRALDRLHGAPVEVERGMQAIASEFPDVPALVQQRLASASPRELADLMLVTRRFATPALADEILFQLLARPVGAATQGMLETLVVLKGDEARACLRACIRGRIAAVRRAATEILARDPGPEELDFALALTDEQSLDLRLAGIVLLGAVSDPKAVERLVALLAEEPTIAGASCVALQKLGRAAAPQLQQAVTAPPLGRSFAYAAFLLATLDEDGTLLPPPEAAAALAQALEGTDPIARALAAVALGRMRHRGRAEGVADAAVAAALLDVVAPVAFVPNFEMLRRPAEAALQALTGRTGREALGWREWWNEVRGGFVGLRARIDVDRTAAGRALVLLRGERTVVRLIGEDLADLPPHQDTREYVLDRDAMMRLVTELLRLGFMQPKAVVPPLGLPLVRSIELAVGDARVQLSAPIQELPAFDQMEAAIGRCADAELWHLLRHPEEEPERGAFWRAERQLRSAQEDPAARDRRNLQRAVKVWPSAPPVLRRLVLAWLLQLDRRSEILRPEDGRALLQLAAQDESYGKEAQAMVELAASTPGDEVWRECIEAAARLSGQSRPALDGVFSVLGADRILAALADPRADVRRAAIDQVVASRDLRAQERLLQMFADPEPRLRRAAVYAAGELAFDAAREPLVGLIADEATDAALRRDSLVALGKVGGEGTFSILQRALAAPVAADRDAALRGLGELDDPRAAEQLASVFAASIGQPSGELARMCLVRMGARLAAPALLLQLSTQNQEVRTQIVLMLGAWQEPRVVPDLIALLDARREPILVGGMLACTTGLDVEAAADPVLLLQTFWRENRSTPQWRWLLAALEREQIPHALVEAQFDKAAGMAAAPELARLLVEAEPGRIRVLAAAALRDLTGVDFGSLTPTTPVEVRQQVALRYRDAYESARAAQGR